MPRALRLCLRLCCAPLYGCLYSSCTLPRMKAHHLRARATFLADSPSAFWVTLYLSGAACMVEYYLACCYLRLPLTYLHIVATCA